MAVTTLNWVFLVLSFVAAIPGSALLWRVYDALDASAIKNPLQRLAQYESCSFVFFFIINAAIVSLANKGSSTAVLRVLSIGVLFYITILGYYVDFTNLNNLRIVDMSSTKVYSLPNTNSAAGQIDTVNQRKLLGGLILGYFSLFFGLLSTISSESKLGQTAKPALFLWFFSLILAIPGVVVCWSNDSSPTYGNLNSNLEAQTLLFGITTVTLVQWFVLTLGLFNAAEDLLSASGFIFGVAGLYFPIKYFYLQSFQPSDADFIWAGPILCWIATFVMALSAILAQSSKKEATV